MKNDTQVKFIFTNNGKKLNEILKQILINKTR